MRFPVQAPAATAAVAQIGFLGSCPSPLPKSESALSPPCPPNSPPLPRDPVVEGGGTAGGRSRLQKVCGPGFVLSGRTGGPCRSHAPRMRGKYNRWHAGAPGPCDKRCISGLLVITARWRTGRQTHYWFQIPSSPGSCAVPNPLLGRTRPQISRGPLPSTLYPRPRRHSNVEISPAGHQV